MSLLTVVPPYCDTYASQDSDDLHLPRPLTHMYNKKYELLSAENLPATCKQIMASFKQAHSMTWFEQRKGRITSSNFHAALHILILRIHQSLILKITSKSFGSFNLLLMQSGMGQKKRNQ